jgi:hypothetical protein
MIAEFKPVFVSLKNFDGAGDGIRTRGGLRQRILSPPPFPRGSNFDPLLRPGSGTPATQIFTTHLRHKCYLSMRPFGVRVITVNM